MGVQFPLGAQNNFLTEIFCVNAMWYLYIAECKDGTLYTGITTNIKRREWEHNNDNKHGAKSLKYKRPVKIRYFEQFINQTDARAREIEIKGWKRLYKLKLIGH